MRYQQIKTILKRGVFVFSLITLFVIVAPADAQANDEVLVGFGDSVAAGFRASDTISDSPYAQNCARTDSAYPTKLGIELGMTTYNLACSGATISEGLNGEQTTPLGIVPSQIDQARSLPHASVATITILANDVDWSGWLSKCIDPSINCATDANTATFRAQLTRGSAGLARSLAIIHHSLRVNKVELTGYYDPMGGEIAAQFGLTPEEITWYRARLTDVNSAERILALLYPHTTYVAIPLDAPSGDIQLSGDGIFHPTDQGQAKIATFIKTAYHHHHH